MTGINQRGKVLIASLADGKSNANNQMGGTYMHKMLDKETIV